MHKLFVDTNILLDWLMAREPFSEAAIELVRAEEKGQIQLYTSAIAIADITYIISSQLTAKETRATLKKLLGVVRIYPTLHGDIEKAIEGPFHDLEDAFQYQTALNLPGLFGIITRNKKDFKQSMIPVYSAKEYLDLMR